MDRSQTIRAHAARHSSATRAGLAVVLAGFVATVSVVFVAVSPAGAKPGNDNRTPTLPAGAENIAVGAGHKVAYEAYAEGVQVYRWNGATWDFVGPEALLFANDGGNGVVGIHYAGPTWESNSGSKVVGAVAERATPNPDAIPWLKLTATSSTGPGVFKDITFIQRVNTVGGKAPADAGDFVGEFARVPYAADYVFYRKHK